MCTVSDFTNTQFITVSTASPHNVVHPAISSNLVNQVILANGLFCDIKFSILGKSDVDNWAKFKGLGRAAGGIVALKASGLSRASHGVTSHNLQPHVWGEAENLK